MQFYYICRRDYSYFTEFINKKQKKKEKKTPNVLQIQKKTVPLHPQMRNNPHLHRESGFRMARSSIG